MELRIYLIAYRRAWSASLSAQYLIDHPQIPSLSVPGSTCWWTAQILRVPYCIALLFGVVSRVCRVPGTKVERCNRTHKLLYTVSPELTPESQCTSWERPATCSAEEVYSFVCAFGLACIISTICVIIDPNLLHLWTAFAVLAILHKIIMTFN